MTVQKIKSGRVTSVTAEEFIGDLGQIFYNQDKGDLRLSDGITPGGIPILIGSGNAQISIGDTPPNSPSQGNLWYNTTDNNLRIYYSSQWIVATYSVDLTHLTQDVIPNADVTHDLGSPTHQWRNVYVGAGTLYIGGIPISNVGGALTIDAPLTITNPSGITFSDGSTISSGNGTGGGAYVLPKASATVLGGVKIGTNINIDNTGVISVPKGAGINTVTDIGNVYTGGPGNPNLTNGSLLIYNSGANRWETSTRLNQEDVDGGEF